MKDTELQMQEQEQSPAKKPYNIRERKIKNAAYRGMIRPELADELYDKIMNIVVFQKKYKDPNYSARDLAKELKTNARYLSAVINSRFGKNYSCLLNEYRIKEALHLLVDKRYAEKNVEEISALVGLPTDNRSMLLFIRTWVRPRMLTVRNILTKNKNIDNGTTGGYV